jgi:hypothetical protein
MNGKELLTLLNNLTEEQKELEIRIVCPLNNEDDENVWLNSLEISNTGRSGYEEEGEIRLIGNF